MDPDHARQHLSDEQIRLEGVRGQLVGDGLTSESEQESVSELSSVDQHPSDLGTETFNRERDLSILEQVESELADVEHALQRLDEGTYWTCEACGRPIGEARLEAMPSARFCVDDQAGAEREAQRPSDTG